MWAATVSLFGTNTRVGYCEDFTEAVAYRLAAEQCLNWSGCDSSSPAYTFMQEYVNRKSEDNRWTQSV